MKEADRIGRAVIAARLAACVNIVRGVGSIFCWKGKVEKAREFLLILKTTADNFSALEKKIKRLHSYEVPEIIALPVAAGSAEYLRWVSASVRNPKA